jgi:hemerythrin-like domain-containing protein
MKLKSKTTKTTILATRMLEHEHHHIQKVAAAMMVLADRLDAGQPVAVETLQKVVQFMQRFGDICHHGKEEQVLFPLLKKKGVPMHGCPVGALLHEHEEGRTLMRELARDVETCAGGGVLRASAAKTLHRLAELYPAHIWKEDYLLFPMTDKILTMAEQKQLARRFAAVEKKLGGGTHRQYERLAEEIEVAVQRSVTVPAKMKTKRSDKCCHHCGGR